MNDLSKQQGCLIGYIIGNTIGNGYLTDLVQRNKSTVSKQTVSKQTVSSKKYKQNLVYLDNKLLSLKKGEISYEIKLSISIIRHLIDKKIYYDNENLFTIYKNWATKQEIPFLINNLLHKVLINSENISECYHKSLHNYYSLDNNSFFIRIVPIVHWMISSDTINTQNLKLLIASECKLSHPNKSCIDAGIIFAKFTLYSYEYTSKDFIFDLVLSQTENNYHKELIKNSKKSPFPINQTVNNTTISTDSNLKFEYFTSLQCVLHCFYKHNSFVSCLEAVINLGGDTATNGMMIGTLAGTYYSMEKIPLKYISVIENCKKNKLMDLIILSGHKIILKKNLN